MYLNGGIVVDAWVKLDGQCEIECDVVGGEAQFSFGSGRAPGLQMIVTEAGLAKLMRKGGEALAEIRSTT